MQGSLLAQVRPSVITPTAAYSPSIQTEITRIVICNTTDTATTFGLYHADASAPYGDANALYKLTPIGANGTILLPADSLGLGVVIKKGGSLAVEAGAVDALTFSIYGSTQNIAPRQA